MATFTRKSDPMVSCPYNQAHRMLKSRLQMHLVKCKKDNATVQKQVCPFNAQHLCDPDTFMAHLSICQDRCIIDRQLVQSKLGESDFRGATHVPSYHSNIENFSEVWDLNEQPVAGYEPEKHIHNKNYLVKDMAHLKPAEKRKYYQESFCQSKNESSEAESSSHAVMSRPEPTEGDIVTVRKDQPELLKNVIIPMKPPRGLGRGQLDGELSRPRLAANFSMLNRENNARSSLSADLSHLSLGIGRGRLAASKRT